jgi:hypothetical protein
VEAAKEAERQQRERAKRRREQAAVKRLEVLDRKIDKALEAERRDAAYREWLDKIDALPLDQTVERKTKVNEDIKQDGKWVLQWTDPVRGFLQSRLGALHNRMTQRGKPGSAVQQQSKAYEGVTVHPYFKDPQKFCDWVVSQPGWGLGYNLDKDLLVPGNRQYGPDVCCFLPAIINTAIIQPKKGAYRRKAADGTWTVYIGINCQGLKTQLIQRGYATEDEAIAAYKDHREAFVKRLAQHFKPTISNRAYQALMTWELQIQEKL